MTTSETGGSPRPADEVIDHQVTVIHEQWVDVADEVGLTTPERDRLWGRQILNPFAGYTG